MNKRIVILTIVLLVLSGIAYYLIKGQTKDDTIDNPWKRLILSENQGLTNIVIWRPKLQPLQFNKYDKGWLVNNKYKADEAVFGNMLRALQKMHLSYIPSVATAESILKSKENSCFKIQMHNESNTPFKTINICADAPKGRGTFVFEEGSSNVYVMQLPGVEGGIKSRFEQPVNNYINKIIFENKADEISSITIEYNKSEASSFTLFNNNKNISIEPLIKNQELASTTLNMAKVQKFLNSFHFVGSEGIIMNAMEADTILSKVPFCTIELKTTKGRVIKNTFYSYDDFVKKNQNTRTPEEGRMSIRFLGRNNEGLIYTIQVRNLQNLLNGYKDFFKN